MRTLFYFVYASIFCCQVSATGNSVGNAGDMVAADFVMTASHFLIQLEERPAPQSRPEVYKTLKLSVLETKVHSKDSIDEKAVCQDGVIEVSRAWWLKTSHQKSHEREILITVLHAYLQCGHLEDQDFSISTSLVDGDEVSAQFIDIGDKIAATLGRIETHLVPVIKNAKVQSQDRVFLEGVEVDAANYPDQSLIVVNRSRWMAAAAYPGVNRSRSLLALHEYLWLAGYDQNYQVSQIFMSLLENEPFCRPYCPYFQKTD